MPKSRRKRRSKSKSGYFGVIKVKSGRYQARMRINIDNKPKYLGSYDTARQAANAYDKEAIILQRPFSTLNFPKRAPAGYTPIQQPLFVTKASRSTNFEAKIVIGGNAHTWVHTTQQKKLLPLPSIALFSKPTNPQRY